jgi:hypothetical protein
MAFALSFAGVPFCVDQPEISAWIDKHICLDDLRETMEPARWPGRNLGSAGAHQWPRRPKLRLGQFFYPVGASRWSEFYGLMTATQLRSAMALAFTHEDTGPVPQPFIIQSDADDYTPDSPSGVTTNLFMLPPRPLSQLQQTVPETPPTIDDLYLIHLVDERYFWRLRGVAIADVATTWSWSAMITAIATELQVTINMPTILPAYGAPAADSALWTSGRDNVAELLDRIAFNIGCLVVRAYDGTYSLVPVDPKTYPVTQKPWRIAGGEIDAPPSLLQTVSSNTYVPYLESILPTNITVLFPSYLAHYGYFVDHARQAAETEEALARFIPWVRDPYLAMYPITVALSSSTGVDEDGNTLSTYGGNGMEVIFRDAAVAHFADYGDSSPSNSTGLQDLAEQLANDYWNFLAGGNDEVYPGIRNWTPDPYHDILYSYSHERTATTRVQRMPYNVWPQDFAHVVAETDLDGPSAGPAIEVVKVASSATPDSHHKYDANVQRWDSGAQSWDTNAEAVWLLDPNGATLSAGSVYGGCRLIGFADGRKVYAAGQAITGTSGGGGSAAAYCTVARATNYAISTAVMVVPFDEIVGGSGVGGAWTLSGGILHVAGANALGKYQMTVILGLSNNANPDDAMDFEVQLVVGSSIIAAQRYLYQAVPEGTGQVGQGASTASARISLSGTSPLTSGGVPSTGPFSVVIFQNNNGGPTLGLTGLGYDLDICSLFVCKVSNPT